MNPKFEPLSKPIRSALAAAAVLATVILGRSIDGLAQHYDATAQAAGAQPLVVARR